MTMLLSTLADPPSIKVISPQTLLLEECEPMDDLVPDWVTGGKLVQSVQRVRKLKKLLIAQATSEERMRGPVIHRALPDAEALWRVWMSVKGMVAEEMKMMREL